MANIPVFKSESKIPRTIGGLELERIQHYQRPELGISVRYSGAPMIKADAYLYDLGVAQIPTDLTSPDIVEWFNEAVGNTELMAKQDAYRDFQITASQYLHVPPESPEPFCLWAAFSYRQSPGPGTVFDGVRVSNLAFRTDRGHFNKIRYTYPGDLDPDIGMSFFLRFALEWTSAVNEA